MPGRLVHIPLWWLFVGIATCVLTPILSIWASVKIAQSNDQEDLARRCAFYNRTLDVYDREPPITETGRALREAYLLEYRYLQCTPERS